MARSGAGIWHGPDHRRNNAIRVPGTEQSNQIGEVIGAVVALQETPPEITVCIRTDSRYVMDGVTKFLTDWEDRGWIGISTREQLKALTYQLRKRTAPTEFEKVKAHTGEADNEGADQTSECSDRAASIVLRPFLSAYSAMSALIRTSTKSPKANMFG
jgi:ribonuclease HI